MRAITDHMLESLRRRHGTLRGWVRHVLALLEWRVGRLRAVGHGDPLRARRLVFVCLGNINRSAFGAAVARSRGVAETSIGLSTTTGAPATPMAINEAARRGYQLDFHRATDISDYSFAPGDLLLVMEVRHARALLARGIPADAIAFLGLWSDPRRVHLHDPHTLSAAYFETCFGLIESAVLRLLAVRTPPVR